MENEKVSDVAPFHDEMKEIGIRPGQDQLTQQKTDVKGIVLILRGDAPIVPEEHLERLISLFRTPDFLVEVVDAAPPAVVKPTSSMSSRDIIEQHRVLQALGYAQQNWPDKPTLIVKETSTSASSADVIAQRIGLALQVADFDLCYLAKWQDQCQKYVDATINGEPITPLGSIVRTQSPHGIQALLFTPKARRILLQEEPMKNGKNFGSSNQPLEVQLNEAILAGNMRAICMVPNLLDYDITFATNNSDFLKLNECEAVAETIVSSGSYAKYFWLFLAIILVLIVAWAVIR